MKKYFFALYLLVCSTYLFAQKVNVDYNIENIGDGYNMAFRLTMPYAEIKSVNKSWTSFLKANHAKVKTPKGAINAQNMVINGMSNDSLIVFSRITESDNACLLTAAFQRKGTYIGPATDSVNAKLISQLLVDLGKNLSREGIQNRSEDATKALAKKVKEQSDLTKVNQRMSSDNEKMKQEISSNEKAITSNTLRLEDLKKEISSQQLLIENIKAKTKEIE